MTTGQTKRGFFCRLLFFLPILGCQVIVQAAPCANCLYGQHYCYSDTGACMYGCQAGYKGSTCTTRCENDACKECIIGNNYIEQCTRCHDGYYGPLCNLKCNDNCKRFRGIDICDQFGNCHYGCVKPYTGPKCETQNCPILNCQQCSVTSYNENIYCHTCNTGYYWSPEMWRCISCSAHCSLGLGDCDTSTGECFSGQCEQGWFGKKCDSYCDVKDCVQCTLERNTVVCSRCKTGMFPAESRRQCLSCQGQNCRDTCDSRNGNCVYGCIPGYYGVGLKCNRYCTIPNCKACSLDIHNRDVCATCEEGYHSDQYQLCAKCSESCKDQSCDLYSGKCDQGCEPGHYGDNCQYTCGENCVGNVCDDKRGTCTCLSGWYGDRCNDRCPSQCMTCDTFFNGSCVGCEAGFYGSTCELSCSDNCRKSDFNGFLYCDQATGDCIKGCYDGYYGLACNKTCSPHCDSHLCEKDTGKCSMGCSGSWYGEKCEMACPSTCTDVIVGWSFTCDYVTGRCMHGCKTGFYGDYCNKTCSIRCKHNKCDSNSGQCSDGCVSGFTGKNCDLICGKSCPSECSPNCLKESCDKKTKSCMSGCIRGWYGTNCQEICSDKCRDRECDQPTGECIGPCVTGFYGGRCSFQCSSSCVQNTCRKDTGYCTLGCQPSFHGPDCTLTCSDQCQNKTCNRNTGQCLNCGIGRRGAFCEQGCLPGTHGQNCEEQCGNCKDYSPCYTSDGRCPSGCEAGWTGPTCAQALYTSESGTGPSLTMQIAIGCSVGGALCALIIVSLVCWLRKVKSVKEQKAEPVVMYSNAEVQIQSVHQPCTSLQVNRTAEDGCSQSSNISIQSQSAMLLGDCETGSQIRILQTIWHGKSYTLHKGHVTIQGQTEECCVKFVQLTDLADKSAYVKRLMKESEILSTCSSHINIINMITTYQNTEVYCVALNNSMQARILPYLHSLQTGSRDGEIIEPGQVFQILQFTVDCCSAVCHLHNLKIIHRTLQAGHVYLSDNMVAKLGDFEYAETVTMDTDLDQDPVEMEALPDEFFPWLSPESFLKKEFAFSSDIWALGLLFWEIITLGKQPFDGLEIDAHQQAVMDGVRPSKPPLAHFTLYRLMKSCWRYDIDDRPTAQDLLQQLLGIQGRHTEMESIVVHV